MCTTKYSTVQYSTRDWHRTCADSNSNWNRYSPSGTSMKKTRSGTESRHMQRLMGLFLLIVYQILNDKALGIERHWCPFIISLQFKSSTTSDHKEFQVTGFSRELWNKNRTCRPQSFPLYKNKNDLKDEAAKSHSWERFFFSVRLQLTETWRRRRNGKYLFTTVSSEQAIKRLIYWYSFQKKVSLQCV